MKQLAGLTAMRADQPSGPMVRVHVELTYVDFCVGLYASRLLSPRLSIVLRLLFGFTVMFLFAIALAAGGKEVDFASGLCIGSVVLLAAELVGQATLAPLSRWRRWQAFGDFRLPHSYLFSPSGFQVSTAGSTLQLSWKEIISARQADMLLVLTSRKGNMYIVPLDAFETPEESRTFQQLVETLVLKDELR